ncbi:TatD family hydrolase [bacterium]|nr:TatD family hydrolase [bacterium]
MTDTHTHLTEEPLISSIDEIIERAKENGVDKFIVPGYNPDSWRKARKLASVHNEIFFAVGLHPMFIHEENRDAFEKELKDGGAIAVGEIGLDFYKSKMKKEAQICVLRNQLQLAVDYDLPVIFHCRKAYDDLLKICKEFPQIKAVMHSCSCSSEQIKPFLELGYYISFSGTITQNRNLKVWKLACTVPIEKMIVETDSPFIGTNNHPVPTVEPSHIPEIVTAIAEIKGESAGVIGENAEKNAKELFELT